MKVYGIAWDEYTGYADAYEQQMWHTAFLHKATAEAKLAEFEHIRDTLMPKALAEATFEADLQQEALRKRLIARGVTEEKMNKLPYKPVAQRTPEEVLLLKKWYYYRNPYDDKRYKELLDRLPGGDTKYRLMELTVDEA